MTRHYPLHLIGLVLLVIGLTMGSATAQYSEEADAVLSARSYQPISLGARIAVRLADDTELNQRLAKVAEEALRNAGYNVVEDNPAIVLRLETQRLIGIGPEDQSVGSLDAGSGYGRPEGTVGGPRGVGVEANLRLWSSTRNSLLKPSKPTRAPKQGFGVVFNAYDEIAGKAAWRGDARTDSVGGDSFGAGSVMVRRLIDVLGRAVDATPISLQR